MTTPDPWLTPEQLRTLTGYQRQAEQIAWLERNKFRNGTHYFVTAAGKPRLLRVALENREAPAPTAGAQTVRAVGPDLAAIR